MQRRTESIAALRRLPYCQKRFRFRMAVAEFAAPCKKGGNTSCVVGIADRHADSRDRPVLPCPACQGSQHFLSRGDIRLWLAPHLARGREVGRYWKVGSYLLNKRSRAASGAHAPAAAVPLFPLASPLSRHTKCTFPCPPKGKGWW